MIASAFLSVCLARKRKNTKRLGAISMSLPQIMTIVGLVLAIVV